jgi:hypothetical protein
MRSLLALPTSILTLLLLCTSPSAATSDTEKPWPYNLPRHMKYFPEDEPHVKRAIQTYERLLREQPVGVKKMSTDEGEMFMLDNWIFGSDIQASKEKGDKTDHAQSWLEDRSTSSGNTTAIPAIFPLRLHSEHNLPDTQLHYLARAILLGRGFQCPTGTKSCTSISKPDSCCGTTDTCISITDNGFGDVGCCPQGQTCRGSIKCDEKNGYSSCPDSPNGGCCLPGYRCAGVGCKFEIHLRCLLFRSWEANRHTQASLQAHQ